MRYNVEVSKDQITVHEWKPMLLGQPGAGGRLVSRKHTSVYSGLLLGEAVESRFFSHQHRLVYYSAPDTRAPPNNVAQDVATGGR